ncbi:MAG: hypothetical protein E6K18_05590 [Methanobacteriota archaeon]|nr:MAG: hypothetical protein E6K18_05590 [Euryarchaeota archaeon]
MADPGQIATSIGFAALFLVATVLAILAYWSVRSMDQVVLRARMYMNRQRLFSGLLAGALAMIILTIVILVSLASTLLRPTGSPADTTVQSVLLIGFVASFLFLAWSFLNFYALSRPPRETTPESGQ